MPRFVPNLPDEESAMSRYSRPMRGAGDPVSKPRTRRFFRKRWVAMAGVFVLFWWLMTPRFWIRTFEFEGNNFIEEPELVRFSGRYLSRHMLKAVVIDRLNKRFESTFPQIQSVSLALVFPSKVIVKIQEKRPVMVFQTSDGTLFVSEDGVVLKHGEGNAVIDNLESLFIVKGIDDARLQQDHVEVSLIRPLQHVLHQIRDVFPDDVFQIDFIRPTWVDNTFQSSGIVLLKDDTIPIQLGEPVDLPSKLSALKLFLDQYDQNRPITAIDLRLKDKVYVQYGSKN